HRLHLSQREQECLTWASQGKTAWETSEILMISENTVRDYIKSACKKLGVYSKNHAIVKAMLLGLIRPNI
ncbi:MAG: helix-turn-helix transcriptional regulator, partial [Alphaproteobacteria bacterium]|nr:helix-turn-helix transcriptional regulator [Alphaproteobacteria bacterium]